ncbi:hypothetical protein JVU11DRAFT_3240 [Chiua virens]|nr:hypothetical protein JVU11DRAFT_3240 [Chiua virens]
MHSHAVLSLIFIAVAVAPVMAVGATPAGTGIAELFEGFSRNMSMGTRFWQPSYDIGPVLNDAVQQGLVARGEVNVIFQTIHGSRKRQAYMKALHDLLDNKGLIGIPMNKRQAYMNALHDLLENNGLSGLGQGEEYTGHVTLACRTTPTDNHLQVRTTVSEVHISHRRWLDNSSGRSAVSNQWRILGYLNQA